MDRVTFWDLMKESVIVQGLVALTCIIGTFALLVAARPVPDYVWVLDATVISYFFGAKSLMSQRQAQIETARIVAQVTSEGIARGASSGVVSERAWVPDDRSQSFKERQV